MNKITLSYLAGVMDSDGYFSIRRSTYSIRKTKESKNPLYFERIGIKQTQPEVINLIYDLFGGYKNCQKPNTKNGKLLYAIQLTNLKANKFIQAIYPFLILKKKQAKILLNLRNSLSEGKKGKTTSGKSCISKKQLDFRENLRQEIFFLNDHRVDKFHQPLPY